VPVTWSRSRSTAYNGFTISAFGTVFSQAIGLEDTFLMNIIVFPIQIVTVLAAVFCANKIPRRPLLLTTTLIMTASIFIVSCLGIPGSDVSSTFGKVIITFVIIEITAFNFAWGPLGWTIVSAVCAIEDQLEPLTCLGFGNGSGMQSQQDLRHCCRQFLDHSVGDRI
jgi:hypothetical protein